LIVKHRAYILSLSEETRNKFLMRDLRMHLGAKIVLGKNGAEFDFPIYGKQAKIAHFLPNRQLTRNEKACVDGHRKMIRQAVEDDVDIAYFLEDDAELPLNFSHIINDTSLVNIKPILCLIAYERERILCRKILLGKLRNFYKCYSMPTCAQFYMINKPALLLLDKEWQEREYTEVADFPTWYWDQIEFLLAPSNQSAHVVRKESTIGIARFDQSDSYFLRRAGKYTCIFWLLYLKEFMTLRAYFAMVHARLIRNLIRMFFG
jgi:GR25 family glycosyltransferase involved in LPS biosynthesis